MHPAQERPTRRERPCAAALLRGGDFGSFSFAGPFALGGTDNPLGSVTNGGFGFRCAKGL
jgi:hypothetical protein